MLMISAGIMLLIGLAVTVGLIDLLLTTWPSFGMALIAVPVGLIAAAFLMIAFTAAKMAMQTRGTVERPTEGSAEWQRGSLYRGHPARATPERPQR